MKTINSVSNASKRQTSIELLRIICMLLIIAHHCIGHGGAAYMETCSNRVMGLLLIPGGKICFNAFLAISAWFMVDQTFKLERFFKTWLQVLFYSVCFAVIAFFLGNPMELKDWVSIFFPIAGNSHGFAASYLAFYLLTPFLKMITENLTEKQAKIIVLSLLYFEVGTQLIGNFTQYFQPIPSELLLFIMCYFIAYYLKKYPLRIQQSKLAMFTVFLICWMAVFIIVFLYLVKMPQNPVVNYFWNIVKDESSIFNIVGGYALFFIFYNIKLPSIQVINKISKHVFGVLLMHDNNFFRAILWLQLLKTGNWYYSPYFLFYVLLATVGIFVIGVIIDWLREKLLEKPILKLACVKRFCLEGDKIYNGK